MASPIAANAAKAKSAVAQPANTCPADCPPCARVGLPILLVRPSITEAREKAVLDDAGFAFAPNFDAEFGKQKREATLPLTRVLREGFVFVLNEAKKKWDIWRIDAAGCTKLLARQISVDEYRRRSNKLLATPAGFACSQKAANLPINLITISDASNVPNAWLAYSEHLWTPAVLENYTEGTKREARMTPIAVKALVKEDVFPPNGALPLNTAALQHNVLEFCEVKGKATALVKAFERSTVPLDSARFGKAAELSERVRGIEKASGSGLKNKALVVMLKDPLGLAAEHNGLRQLVEVDRQAWKAGGKDVNGKNEDPDRAWKRQSDVHIGYIHEWLRQRVKDRVTQRVDQMLHGVGGMATKAQFDERKKAGLYPPDTIWHPIKDKAGNPDPRGMGQVIYSQAHVDKGVEKMGGNSPEGTISKYMKKIDETRRKQFHIDWARAENEWAKKVLAVDSDYIEYLKSKSFCVFMDQDFDDIPAISTAKRSLDEIQQDMYEAAARVNATEKALAGGLVSDASLKFMAKMFDKPEDDPQQWIAQALITEFGLAKLLEPDVTADLYDSYISGKAAKEELQKAWAGYAAVITQQTNSLLATSQQAIAELERLVADTKQAKKFQLASNLDQVKAKQVVWVKASALLDYLNTGNRHYFVWTRWSMKSFMHAMSDALKEAPLFETQPTREIGKTGKERVASAKQTRQQIREFSEHLQQRITQFGDDVTVGLVYDESVLKQSASRRGEKMLKVVGDNLLGKPGMATELPEDLAKQIIKKQAMTWKQMRANLLENKTTVRVSFAIFMLEAFAIKKALTESQQKGGLEQRDEILGVVSGVVTYLGLISELAAAALTPRASMVAGTPSATQLVSTVPKHLAWRLAAGIFGAAGSILDGASNIIKTAVRLNKGDRDAAAAYVTAGIFQFGGGTAMAAGSVMAFQAAMAERAAGQAALRAGGGAAARVLLGTALASSLTGIGLILWIAGVGISIVAMMLEDDEIEVFLDRSHFGKHKNTDLGHFPSFEREVQAFAGLAHGFAAEIEWNDEMIGSDEITVRIKSAQWSPKLRATYRLQGFAEDKRTLLAELGSGDFPELKPDEDNSAIHTASALVLQTNSRVEWVCFTWRILGLQTDGKLKQIAQDHIWMED